MFKFSYSCFVFTVVTVSLLSTQVFGQSKSMSTIAEDGWANNSVNTVIFRKNSLITANGFQYVAYYDTAKYIVLGKRKSGSADWLVKRTSFQGDATDAHKSISISIDGENYLHVAWGQHNNPLNYAKSISPGSLELTGKLSMIGVNENRLSYPEFYKLEGGNLLFLYRDGGSGNGNLIVNRYEVKSHSWHRLQNNLIDGQGKRSAYWQVTTDHSGTIHLSWVWRESPDVASNHDMAYARSRDGGLTWEKTSGERYQLPITAENAEYACKVPQSSELINQTSMFADAAGHPFIATYWRELGKSVPQYHIIYNTDGSWKISNLGFRKTDFSLSGSGTKKIPISRPQIVAWQNEKFTAVALVYRDEESGNRVSIASSPNVQQNKWSISYLTSDSVGAWEPTYDPVLWSEEHVLSLFVQKNVQVDGEGKANVAGEPVRVIDWKPKIK